MTVLKTTKLYTLKQANLWYVHYISIRLLKKKNYDKGRKKHSTANPLASKEDNDIWENPKFNDP